MRAEHRAGVSGTGTSGELSFYISVLFRLKISKDGDMKTLPSCVVVSSLFLRGFLQPLHPIVCLRLPVGSQRARDEQLTPRQ